MTEELVTLVEAITGLRTEMIEIERDNINPDLKIPISKVIGKFNKLIKLMEAEDLKQIIEITESPNVSN